MAPDKHLLATENGVPKGSRTPVTAVKGPCPRPLDDGDTVCLEYPSLIPKGSRQASAHSIDGQKYRQQLVGFNCISVVISDGREPRSLCPRRVHLAAPIIEEKSKENANER